LESFLQENNFKNHSCTNGKSYSILSLTEPIVLWRYLNALQDIASAAVVYEKALNEKLRMKLNFVD
jgi:hypothetical protein